MAKKGMLPQKQEIVVFAGGLDIVTPPQSVEPGKVLSIQNYICDLNGGYSQAAGFERFDGRQSPVGSSFIGVDTAPPSGIFLVGEPVSGADSGATGFLLYIGATGMYFVGVIGTFHNNEVITGGTRGYTALTTSGPNADMTLSSAEIYNDLRYLKEIYYRDLIQQVPGTGPIRGAFRHEAITLAVRDFDGGEARMYKASATGWTAITASWVLFFDTGTFGNYPLPGTAIDDGVGNNAVIQKIGLVTTGGAVGYMVITGFTSGFAVGTNVTVTSGPTIFAVVATDGAPAPVTLLPGGKNEWRSHTFTGAPDFYKVYTADGINPAMEYNPIEDILLPIYTDQAFISIDTPKFLDIYHNHLVLGYSRGIIRNSDPSLPFLWDSAAGALEIAVGAEVTGFDAAPKSLIVTTKRTTYALTGQTADNFVLDVASAKTGAIPYTVQHIGTTHTLDDRGIIDISRVQAFGNFENATISRLIQPLLLRLRSIIVASRLNLAKNTYSVFTSDGEGVVATFQEGKLMGFGSVNLGETVNCMSSAEDETGLDRTFFGGNSGYVYEMDRGVSFDGEEKSSWIQTVYHDCRSPTIRKRFHRAFFDVVISGTSYVKIFADFSNGSSDVRSTVPIEDEIIGFEGTWDTGQWNTALFDSSSLVGNAYTDLTGTGDTISLILFSKSAKDDTITFKDVIYKYKQRRGLRGNR